MLLAHHARDTVPAPFEVLPSEAWLGNDGNWSTFSISIGEGSSQSFNVLPSTAGQATIVPLAEGCTDQDPSNCEILRGSVDGDGLNTTNSSFNYLGLYTSPLEQRLLYSVAAEYGLDYVTLECATGGALGQNSSLVLGVAATDFYLGLLGLGTQTDSLPGASVIPAFISSLFEPLQQ
ncbi:hypothetical protein M8818_003211 [Zalaria obscura]|uniref:Uncharacterized protein n=1 Tax=Zalaria obscura TaxID=2024903 RepID=A0ACC3SFW8_9PEZI